MPTDASRDLLRLTDKGLYCPPADVHIDPWRPVSRAVITHAHSDHARPGMGHYCCTPGTAPILRHRLGADIGVQVLPYGEILRVGDVRISFHPAGHIPGSAQVRLEHRGEVWVVSGDYKTVADGLSEPFEAVPCHTFITESTFGLPVFRWAAEERVMEEIGSWWAQCRAEGRVALLLAYSLGKAQRLLHRLGESAWPVRVHPAIAGIRQAWGDYLADRLPDTPVWEGGDRQALRSALVIAPPAAAEGAWARSLGPRSLAIASGWMALRGTRRRRAADRGFALSDHADWDGLNQAVRATGAERVLVTHGYAEPFARWLREQGLEARPLDTPYGSEDLAGPENPATAD